MIRGTDVTEYRFDVASTHTGGMFAARITLRRFSVSSAMNLPNSAGDRLMASHRTRRSATSV